MVVDTGNSAHDIAALAEAGIVFSVSGVKAGETFTFTVNTDQDEEAITVTTSGNISQTIALDGTSVAAGTILNFDAVGLTISFTKEVNLTASLYNDNSDGGMFGDRTITTGGTSVVFQIGANQDTKMDISIGSMMSDVLGTGADDEVGSIKEVDVTAAGAGFDINIQVIDKAIAQVSAQRSQLGAWQNRLEHTINNLGTSSENLTAAESRIRDVDMAKEMMEYAKNTILQQAAQAMLAQANQQPQGVLQLLR